MFCWQFYHSAVYSRSSSEQIYLSSSLGQLLMPGWCWRQNYASYSSRHFFSSLPKPRGVGHFHSLVQQKKCWSGVWISWNVLGLTCQGFNVSPGMTFPEFICLHPYQVPILLTFCSMKMYVKVIGSFVAVVPDFALGVREKMSLTGWLVDNL